jgi:hypothetical protein
VRQRADRSPFNRCPGRHQRALRFEEAREKHCWLVGSGTLDHPGRPSDMYRGCRRDEQVTGRRARAFPSTNGGFLPPAATYLVTMCTVFGGFCFAR